MALRQVCSSPSVSVKVSASSTSSAVSINADLLFAVGGEALVIHPDHLMACLDANTHANYAVANRLRGDAVYRKFNDMFVSNNLIQLKESPPYPPALEEPVLLNPLARASKDATGSYSFNAKSLPTSVPLAAGLEKSATSLVSQSDQVFAVGTDVELTSAVPSSNPTFVERNFTQAEQIYCAQASDSAASFAGRWSAKEAVFKSLKTTSQGAAAAMKDIEITSEGGIPGVKLAGAAAKVAQDNGVTSFELSISHADGVAIAVCVAKK